MSDRSIVGKIDLISPCFIDHMSDHEDKIPHDDTISREDIGPDSDLPGANLSLADLSGADLENVDLSGANLSNADLSEANLGGANLSDANLSGADLSEAGLVVANLSNANLYRANLSGVNFSFANLSGANLYHANLAEANFDHANLSETDLGGADLSDADLRDADLSKADLSGADLSKTLLIGTKFDDAVLSQRTTIDSPRDGILQLYANEGRSKEEQYSQIARVNHELREIYSDNGLLSRARNARFRERKARRREAKSRGGLGTVEWVGSVLSQVFTGYGVRLRWVVGSMLALYLGSAFVYGHWGDMWWSQSLYYSVVTFTTAPPEPPTGPITTVVAAFETFAGTTAIVFLGYVLATRERV
jgi:uncharacterized protein YjbI with pentapeptide repeats